MKSRELGIRMEKSDHLSWLYTFCTSIDAAISGANNCSISGLQIFSLCAYGEDKKPMVEKVVVCTLLHLFKHKEMCFCHPSPRLTPSRALQRSAELFRESSAALARHCAAPELIR